MRIGNFLFSVIEFFFVMAFLCTGFFFVALKWVPQAHFTVAEFFFYHTGWFVPLGFLFLTIGFILLFAFYRVHRYQYYQVQLHTVEPALLRTMIRAYWKNLFPEDNLSTDVFIHADQKLEVVAEVPTLSAKKHEDLIKKAEREIGALLSHQLGYKRELLLTVILKS